MRSFKTVTRNLSKFCGLTCIETYYRTRLASCWSMLLTLFTYMPKRFRLPEWSYMPIEFKFLEKASMQCLHTVNFEKKLKSTTYPVFQHATFKTLSVFYDMNKEHFQNETFYPAPPNSKATDAEKISRIEKLCEL